MMMLPATAVMKAWTPPVKIPITFPWAACVCMFAAMALTMSPSSVCIELMMSPSNIWCKKFPPSAIIPGKVWDMPGIVVV